MDLIFRAWDTEERMVSIMISESENGLFNEIN